MTSKFVKDGETQTYTNATGSAIAAGAVVRMGNTIGVALGAIANNAIGEVRVRGVFKSIPKTAGQAWVHGDVLIWDASAGSFCKTTTLATGDLSNVCTAFGAAASGDTTAYVLFHGIPGTLT